MSTTSIRSVDTLVVLAAGKGERIRADVKVPKPLVVVDGASLAERIFVTFRATAAITKVVVSVGHEKDQVSEHYHQVASRFGINLQVVQSESWRLGSGASALAAESAVGQQPFLLCMADHVFTTGAVARFIANLNPCMKVALAVDRDLSLVHDMEDATKVNIHQNLICKIGKQISPASAIDAGLFFSNGSLFEALANAAGHGIHSLNGGLDILIAQNAFHAIDITGERWWDIDTLGALKHAEESMRGSTVPASCTLGEDV